MKKLLAVAEWALLKICWVFVRATTTPHARHVCQNIIYSVAPRSEIPPPGMCQRKVRALIFLGRRLAARLRLSTVGLPVEKQHDYRLRLKEPPKLSALKDLMGNYLSSIKQRFK